MEPMTLFIILVCVIVGGVFASLGVHLLPVGGAPAAMGTATGIATGTIMLMLGAAVTGLFTASTVATFSDSLMLVSLSGGVGAWIMMGVTMLMANIIYIFGAGVVPTSGRVEVDPLFKEEHKSFKTAMTDGHAVPNVSYVSGMIGALIGGFGGGLMYFALLNYAGFTPPAAAVVAIGVFVANAILAAYNIGGTIEGFHDPKFKRLPKALISCFTASLLCGLAICATSVLLGGAL
ncbi:MAG: tetrahydromethanopterin S-methyltransferase subunit D [Candidatus Methanospirareceae archaeon]